MKTLLLAVALACSLSAQPDVKAALEKPILDPRQPLLEAQVYTASRVPPMPSFRSVPEWEAYAAALRTRILNEIVFRGEAAQWRDAEKRVEFLEERLGGPGYRLRKFRYEAIPGLWIPGLIYEPEDLRGKAPVALNVNGHERTGNATPYIQARCINLARKGVIAVNPEWLGRGQLDVPGLNHYRMPQIDLTGTSGLAVFYLAMQRALDIAASLPGADPARLAVTGLSGGGWQTIFLSSLDTRVAVANPVAGYSSYLTRAQWPDLDLGDSEQTPSDLAAIADYTHLTALMAPRGLQLAYNAKDTCCFRADYAIGPLMQAAEPIYRLYNALDKLRYHINHGPGHNYDEDNREAFYRLLRDHLAPLLKPSDQPVDKEVRTAEQLRVPLPQDNLDFHRIARRLAGGLPRKTAATRAELERVVRFPRYSVQAVSKGREAAAEFWQLKMDGAWTVPAVELSPPAPRSTVLVVADGGRVSAAAQVRELLEAGNRVVAVDPFTFGESALGKRDFLFAMLVAGLGERPLGIQASQVAAAARWLSEERGYGPVHLAAIGPRSSLFGLIAAALDEASVGKLTLYGPMNSLREILDKDMTADKTPELFCFGLLEAFDLPQIRKPVERRIAATFPLP